MSNQEDQERRILEAFFSLVSSRVQAKLPPGRRGLRALDPIRTRIPGAVEGLLGAVVDKIAREVSAEVEFVSEIGGRRVTGRMKVLNNVLACDRCGVVRAVAVVEVENGEAELVECEGCAPEFRPKGEVS